MRAPLAASSHPRPSDPSLHLSARPAVVEALLGYFVTAPPVPLRTKVFQYVPYDARSALRIVRSAAGERCGVLGRALLLLPASSCAERVLCCPAHIRVHPLPASCPFATPPAASVLWLPYQAYTLLLRPVRSASADAEAGAGGAAGSTVAAASASPLGDTALLLLLALVFHAPPQVRSLLAGLSCMHSGLASPGICSTCRRPPTYLPCCPQRCPTLLWYRRTRRLATRTARLWAACRTRMTWVGGQPRALAPATRPPPPRLSCPPALAFASPARP